jgi:hypothetical protein
VLVHPSRFALVSGWWVVYLPLCLAVTACFWRYASRGHVMVAVVFGLLLACVDGLAGGFAGGDWRFAMVLRFSGLGWIERKPSFLKYTHTHPRIYI